MHDDGNDRPSCRIRMQKREQLAPSTIAPACAIGYLHTAHIALPPWYDDYTAITVTAQPAHVKDDIPTRAGTVMGRLPGTTAALW